MYLTRQCVAVDSSKLKYTDHATQNKVAKNGNPATTLLKDEKCTRNSAFSFSMFC